MKREKLTDFRDYFQVQKCMYKQNQSSVKMFLKKEQMILKCSTHFLFVEKNEQKYFVRQY